jgi:2',3'-cyclic-nucleotide 2'-phosphodiesterase/3'-nucleotidase
MTPLKHIKVLYRLALGVILLTSCSDEHYITLKILETTDLHGTILPFDYVENEETDASLASVSTYIGRVKNKKSDIILLDNGDILQGSPSVYYYNFIDTVSPHLVAEVMNYLEYDAATIGNHDIEAGHPVYDRLLKEYHFPVLGANAISVSTGKPYFRPYTIMKKNGLKVAVLGLVTPLIPDWLPPELYSGIEFIDMLETAKKWMKEIKKENPDIIVGLFHDGWDRSEVKPTGAAQLGKNGSASIAYNVPGFDIIFTGHDHIVANEKIVNRYDDTVLILNGGSRAEYIAQAEISLSPGKKKKKVTGEIISVRNFNPDMSFVTKFENYDREISKYVKKVIGSSDKTISTRDSYFGPSAFVDYIHSVQLELTGADISFAAPLSFDVQIPEGPVTIGDMFKLYRYENMLYSMELTGEEIVKYLEYSCSLWFNTMKGPEDMLLRFRTSKDGNPVLINGRPILLNAPYNFDSAAGITYSVDVSKPAGRRICVRSFTDGRPFSLEKRYRVALNSYRGNGGGGHLTEGAGIKKSDLSKRLLESTDKDLRYYIMRSIESHKKFSPVPLNNWEPIPSSWVQKAARREYRQLFGKNK